MFSRTGAHKDTLTAGQKLSRHTHVTNHNTNYSETIKTTIKTRTHYLKIKPTQSKFSVVKNLERAQCVSKNANMF